MAFAETLCKACRAEVSLTSTALPYVCIVMVILFRVRADDTSTPVGAHSFRAPSACLEAPSQTCPTSTPQLCVQNQQYSDMQMLLLQGLMALQALSPASVQEAHQHFSEAQTQLRSAQQQQQTASTSAPGPVSDVASPTPGINQDLGLRQGMGSDAAPAPDSKSEELSFTPEIQVHKELGFDASINWSMLGPAPPRTVPHVSSTEAWAHTEQLLQDLLGTFDVLQVRVLLLSYLFSLWSAPA